MLERTRRSVEIHEAVYLLLWLGLGTALGVTGEGTAQDGWLLGGLAAMMIALIAKGREGWLLQVRLWFPLAALTATYFWMGDAVPRLQDWRADAALCRIDERIFGECLAVIVAPRVPGWGRELLSAAYLLFFPLWIGGMAFAAWRGGSFQRAYFSGFYLVYALGFVGYTLFPAGGPIRHAPLTQKLEGMAEGGWVTAWNDWIVPAGCNGVDVFPSLHTAITLYVLLAALSVSRRLFAVLAIPCALIVCATIGLRYHYSADLVAGALLAAAVWWVTVRAAVRQNQGLRR